MTTIFDLAPPEPYDEPGPSRLGLIVKDKRYREIDPRTGEIIAEGDVREFRHVVRDIPRRRHV